MPTRVVFAVVAGGVLAGADAPPATQPSGKAPETAGKPAATQPATTRPRDSSMVLGKIIAADANSITLRINARRAGQRPTEKVVTFDAKTQLLFAAATPRSASPDGLTRTIDPRSGGRAKAEDLKVGLYAMAHFDEEGTRSYFISIIPSDDPPATAPATRPSR
ncbi:MAG: hypothetical protein NTW19_01555 [Planctomycetota bacterium]|nr:hypothetical protein [Planctomycetota bacterium]